MADNNGYLPLPTGFQTKAIHVGQDPDQWDSRCLIPPITLSTTFKVGGPGEFNINDKVIIMRFLHHT